MRDYPTSRLAVRAVKRAEALRGAMGPDGRDARAIAEWNTILFGFASRPRAESIARAEKLLARPRGAHDCPARALLAGHRSTTRTGASNRR